MVVDIPAGAEPGILKVPIIGTWTKQKTADRIACGQQFSYIRCGNKAVKHCMRYKYKDVKRGLYEKRDVFSDPG